jgi:Zn-dependent protease
MDSSSLVKIALAAVPIILAITVHEAAHGYVARMFGDQTAWMLGRVTLNPLKHVDPIGTVVVPGVLLLTGAPFLFGWAKPVPVNFGNLRHPKRDMFWVAAAGPASNFVMALGWAIVFGLAAGRGPLASAGLQYMCIVGVGINVALMVLNLLPILPLDGGRIAVSLLPHSVAVPFARTERFGFVIVIVLIVTGVLGIVIGPLGSVVTSLLEAITGVNLPGGF